MLFISMTLLRAMNASGASGHGWAPMNSANLYGGGDGGVCVCPRRVRVRVILELRSVLWLGCVIIILQLGPYD